MLKCARTAGGKYGLYLRGANGKLTRVPKIGFSAHPFEIVAQYPGQPFVAIKKRVVTPRGPENRLYLVDSRTGTIPENMTGGVSTIIYDQKNQRFYFNAAPHTLNDAAYLSLMLQMLQAANTTTAPADAAHGQPQIIHATDDMPGVIMEIIPAPSAQRGIKKHMRSKLARRLRRKQRALRRRAKNIRTIAKTPKLKPRKLTAKMQRPAPAPVKPALQAKFTVPYSLRKNPRIKYNAAIKPHANPNKMTPEKIAAMHRAMLQNGAAYAHAMQYQR